MKQPRSAATLILCLGLTAVMASCADPTPTATPIPPTQTATPLPTATDTAVPTDTSTPEPTATETAKVLAVRCTPSPLAKAQGTLIAEATDVAVGDCTVVRWDVGATATTVTFQGAPVAPAGTKQVCPTVTTEYKLAWVNADGSRGNRTVTVQTREPAQRPPDDDEDEDEKRDKPGPTDPPPPTETECVGDECEEKLDPFVTATPEPKVTPEPPEPSEEPKPPADTPAPPP